MRLKRKVNSPLFKDREYYMPSETSPDEEGSYIKILTIIFKHLPLEAR